MIKEKDFFRGSEGKGLDHEYELVEQDGEKVVFDHTTGLTWQRSGSAPMMFFNESQEYVPVLNNQKYAGFRDWRLPTLEEAMSLMEPQKNEDGTAY